MVRSILATEGMADDSTDGMAVRGRRSPAPAALAAGADGAERPSERGGEVRAAGGAILINAYHIRRSMLAADQLDEGKVIRGFVWMMCASEDEGGDGGDGLEGKGARGVACGGAGGRSVCAWLVGMVCPMSLCARYHPSSPSTPHNHHHHHLRAQTRLPFPRRRAHVSVIKPTPRAQQTWPCCVRRVALTCCAGSVMDTRRATAAAAASLSGRCGTQFRYEVWKREAIFGIVMMVADAKANAAMSRARSNSYARRRRVMKNSSAWRLEPIAMQVIERGCGGGWRVRVVLLSLLPAVAVHSRHPCAAAAHTW